MNRKALSSRLREAIEATGAAVPAVAAASGMSESGFRKWLGPQGAEASFLRVVAAAEFLGIDLTWLATGRGSMLPEAAMQQASRIEMQSLSASAGSADTVWLPLLDVSASAGAGAIVEYEDIDRVMSFGREWLRRHHITPHAAQVLTAKGDSMEPTIRTGDLLIVDTDITTPVDSGIYVVNYDGSLLVKRLFRLSNGGLLISSDNKIAGREEELSREDLAHLRIIGRVMWYGRDL